MLGSAVLLSALSFLPKKHTGERGPITTDSTRLVSVILQRDIIPEIKPKINVSQPKVPTTQWISNIKIVAEKEPTPVLGFDPDKTAIGSTTTAVTNTGGPSIVIPEGTGTIVVTEPVKPEINRTIPINNPDVMPSYPGGMDALRRFLERNLHNPKEMEEGEAVSVSVKFIVGYDGKLQGFVPAGAGDEEFYKEVVRVLKKMPEWIPGKANGENIAVYYAIPVKFVPAE